MLRPLAVAALLVITCASCVSATERDRGLRDRRGDFSNPYLAFETLRASIRLDDGFLGYDCIAEEMKERENLTLDKFLVGWKTYFEKNPSARYAGNAEPVRTFFGDRAVLMIVGAYGHELRIEFVRQDYYKVTVSGRPDPVDGYIPAVGEFVKHSPEDVSELIATIRDSRLAGVKPEQITSYLLSIEWKVNGIGDKDRP